MPKIKRKNKWREVEAEGTLNEKIKIKINNGFDLGEKIKYEEA